MSPTDPDDGRPVALGYLCSVYARASHTFIRGEVARLRALGHAVHTFSVRPTDPAELADGDVRADAESTEVILAAGPLRLAAALAAEAARSPSRALAAARLAARIGSPGLKGRLWPFAYLVEAAYLAGRLRARGVGHLHNHFAEGSASVAMLASVLTGVPFSLTVHGPAEFDHPAALALGEKVRRASFTAAVSDFTRGQLLRWTDPDDWGKVRVVRCGLDAADLGRALAPIPEEPRLACVGRLSGQKGQLLLVEAAGVLAAEGRAFEIELVGDGPQRAAVERRVERLGLGGHVRLTGWAGAGAVRAALGRSRALVLPSLAEGLPVVLMEALALGRPVVCTCVAGVPELVEHGVHGWVVPAGSVAALAGALREALEAPAEVLGRMGRAGAERVRARHDGAAAAAQLSALFGRSAARGVGAP